MFAQHRDDKKKIEKALEAAQLPTGKVRPLATVSSGLDTHITVAISWEVILKPALS